MNYSIAYLSYNNADEKLMQRSQEIISQFFQDENFELNSAEGQLLFIASGGSEQHAVERTKNHRNITLLCHRESNSYAAAIEIAAYLRAQNKRVSLIDVFAANAFQEFKQVQEVNLALEKLSAQKAALIGEVSDWLIISDVEKQRIKEKLGVEVLHLPWDKLDDYREQEASEEFLSYFPNAKAEQLTQTAKVYTVLADVIREQELSAISVECFSMVVRDKVTACLPLAVLNAKNSVAACEGDICAMLGKMLVRAIANEIPWQANVAEIKDDTILFAHCTAPLNVLHSFDITTHFETNCGTAVRGKFTHQKMGVFRVNNQLDKYMLLEGDIVNTPDHNFACRTQIELKTSTAQAHVLKNRALGNHHVLFPAKHIAALRSMMQVLGIEEVKA